MLHTRWFPSSLCFLLLPLLLLSSASVPINPYYANCSEHLHCGNRTDINVTYPFRLIQSPNYCGYPGYEINCNLDEEPAQLTIKLGEEDYAIQNVYQEKMIVLVVDSKFLRTDCPLSFTNTSINSTLFRYTSLDGNLTVYVNCSFPIKPAELSEIPCLSNPNWPKKSYYRVDFGPSTFLENLNGSCDLTAVVPVYDKPEQKFEEAIKVGFGLTWNYNMDWCQECKDSGGICGYNESRPGDQICHCSDTSHLNSCFYCKHISFSYSSLRFFFILICSSFSTLTFYHYQIELRYFYDILKGHNMFFCQG